MALEVLSPSAIRASGTAQPSLAGTLTSLCVWLQVPVVLHPCNPTNNLCTALGFVDWDRLSAAAAEQVAVLRRGSQQEVLNSALSVAVAQVAG